MMNYHKRLKYVAIAFSLIFGINAAEYFLLKGSDLNSISGKISKITSRSFFGSSKYTRRTYYTRTTISLNNRSKEYHTVEQTDHDSLLLKLKIGDRIEISTRRLYHYLTFIEVDANMFLVKKNRVVIYSTWDKCKTSNKIIMIISGIMAMIFYILYLDLAKNISLENWFQKKILKNPDYLDQKAE